MRLRASLAILIGTLVLAACSSPVSLGEGVRTDYESAQLKPGDPLFIVQFEAKADLSGLENIRDWDERGRLVVERLKETAATSQAETIAAADAVGARYVSLWISNSIVFAGTPDLGRDVARIPGVAKVWQEEVPTGLDDPPSSSPPFPEPGDGGWEVAALDVPAMHQEGFDGAGITVGIIDTGVYSEHESLIGSYRGRDGSNDYAWFSPLRAFGQKPTDIAGHGTAVAGLAVGDVIGVATGADWIAGLACSEGGCPLAGVVHAMQYMLAPTKLDGSDPRPDLRPQVINSSWVRAVDDEPMRRASEALAASGIFQVYAVGNEGPACDTASPVGEGDSFVSVGATNQRGELSSFSSRGPAPDGRIAPDIVAPGEEVVTATMDGTYQAISGTSFAAPLVSGLVAILLQANPDLIGQPGAIASILRSTAQPMPDDQCSGAGDSGDLQPNDATGWGFVNGSAALKTARAWSYPD